MKIFLNIYIYLDLFSVSVAVSLYLFVYDMCTYKYVCQGRQDPVGVVSFKSPAQLPTPRIEVFLFFFF